MAGLDFARTYLDDFLCLSTGSFDEHLSQLSMILERLREVGLKVNADKSTFCAEEIEYLGYWITRNCTKPLP